MIQGLGILKSLTAIFDPFHRSSAIIFPDTTALALVHARLLSTCIAQKTTLSFSNTCVAPSGKIAFGAANSASKVVFSPSRTADVLLEQRSSQDIHRNALVCVFLRTLEYYQGIMFLTTNRVGQIDDAIASRIHFKLNQRTPSWSWAAVDAPVYFESQYSPLTLLAKALEVEVDTDQHQKGLCPVHGSIRIHGPLRKRPYAAPPTFRWHPDEVQILCGDTRVDVHVYHDTPYSLYHYHR
ncbi:hypothetical protein F5882DRAFT_516145 [Hyaloscypha sp. PMI_1271]|nr:hypothetical protein F5882DRAFT_516145 [Hyaloscypha sp. PMI_1271]